MLPMFIMPEPGPPPVRPNPRRGPAQGGQNSVLFYGNNIVLFNTPEILGISSPLNNNYLYCESIPVYIYKRRKKIAVLISNILFGIPISNCSRLKRVTRAAGTWSRLWTCCTPETTILTRSTVPTCSYLNNKNITISISFFNLL